MCDDEAAEAACDVKKNKKVGKSKSIKSDKDTATDKSTGIAKGLSDQFNSIGSKV